MTDKKEYASQGEPEKPAPLSARVVISMLGVNLMLLMASLDISAINVSLPTMMLHLNTTFSTVQWVVISYTLSIACLLLQFARLGDMYSKKRIFLWGLLIFATASAMCGLSPNVAALIGGRAIQGVGAAMCQALSTAIITELAGPRHLGKALGISTATFAVGLMLGPSLGSMCVSLWNWRAIFFINVPFGVVAIFMVWRFTPDLRPPYAKSRFDIPGAFVAAVTLGAYCLGMTLSQRYGFTNKLPLILFVVVAAGIYLFIRLEKRARWPMVTLKLFANSTFSLNLLVNILSFIVASCPAILPFYLQLARGYSIRTVGLFMITVPCSIAIVSPIAGALADRHGPRLLSFIGMLLLTGSVFSMATLTMTTPWWSIAMRSVLVGCGVGAFQAPNNSSILNAAPKESLGVAAGLLMYARILGQSTGLPLVGTIFAYAAASISPAASRMDFTHSPPEAMVAGITSVYQTVGVILSCCIVILAASWYLELRKRRAHSYFR